MLGSATPGGAVTDKEVNQLLLYLLKYNSSIALAVVPSVTALMSFLQVRGWKCLGFNSGVCVQSS